VKLAGNKDLGGGSLAHILAAAFFAVSITFVYRSFYGMRIKGSA
jgi:hypothetical protein